LQTTLSWGIYNNFFNMKSFFYIFFFLTITLQAQVFYGKKQFGKLEILNDSICTVSFILIPNLVPDNFIDTCRYTQSNDTVFISSKIPNKFKIIPTDEIVSLKHTTTGLLKVYMEEKNNRFSLLDERMEGVAFDTVSNQVILNTKMLFDLLSINNTFNYKLLFVFYSSYYGYLKFSLKNIKSKYLLVKINKNDIHQSLFFNSFPIIIKRNKLIPIDVEKQEKCWLDNGFYFPVMKKNKRVKKYKTISDYRMSLGESITF